MLEYTAMKLLTALLKEAHHLVMGLTNELLTPKVNQKNQIDIYFQKNGQWPGNPMTRLDRPKSGSQNWTVRRAFSFLECKETILAD